MDLGVPASRTTDAWRSERRFVPCRRGRAAILDLLRRSPSDRSVQLDGPAERAWLGRGDDEPFAVAPLRTIDGVPISATSVGTGYLLGDERVAPRRISASGTSIVARDAAGTEWCPSSPASGRQAQERVGRLPLDV
jgi:hypothetical protein